LDGTLSHQARCPGRRDRGHVVQAEGQQHGLLEPLVHDPAVAALFRDAGVAAVQQVQGRVDRLADFAFGFGANGVSVLERVLDGRAEVVMRHGRGAFPLG
jgi:hypothetical protein